MPRLEADRDDPEQGDDDGVVQLCHDGRLRLQVLGDVGVLDLVKFHHLQSHLPVHKDIAKGGCIDGVSL